MHKERLEKLKTQKKRLAEGGSKDRYPERHTEELSQEPGIHQVGKAKALLELNVARDAKGYKKNSCRYIGDKRKLL